MKGKFWYRIFVFSVFVLLLSVGGILGYRLTVQNEKINNYTSKEENDVEYVDNMDKEAVNIYEEEEVETVSTKSYDIEVIYIDFYTLCNEEITTEDIYYGTNLEKIKEQELNKQKKEEIKYDIIEENNERIVFKRMIDKYCPNHFKIILEDKKVNIYNKIDEKEYKMYKTLDVPIETLREEVVDELTGGILIDSKEELNMIIEDIES